MSQGLNKIKCRITSKTTRKLKSKSISSLCYSYNRILYIYLTWMTCLGFVSVIGTRWLELRIKETEFNNVTIQREFQTLWKSFCHVHVYSNQTVWEIKLLLFIEQKKQTVRSQFRFLSMLYIIWVKVLYSNLLQRNVTI